MKVYEIIIDSKEDGIFKATTTASSNKVAASRFAEKGEIIKIRDVTSRSEHAIYLADIYSALTSCNIEKDTVNLVADIIRGTYSNVIE